MTAYVCTKCMFRLEAKKLNTTLKVVHYEKQPFIKVKIQKERIDLLSFVHCITRTLC